VGSIRRHSVFVMRRPFFLPGMLLVGWCIGCGTGDGVRGFVPRGNFSDASLSGQYVYQISGIDFSTNGTPYREAGVWVADGNRHITGGMDDFAEGSRGVASNTISGSYAVNNDGTGNITLNAGSTTLTFAITLVSSSKVYLIEADGAANASGLAEKQDANAFNAVPTGTFVFQTHSLNSDQLPTGEVGRITISNGSATGNADVNRNGASSSLDITGVTFSNPDPTLARGTASVSDSAPATSQFIYYIVDASNIRLLASDPGIAGLGRAEKQSGALTLSGSYAFGNRGDTNNLGINGAQTVGRFTAHGNGTIDSGALDSVQDGQSISNGSFTGAYSAVNNGRTALSLSGSGISIQATVWMVSSSRGFILINDPNKVEDGTLDLQQSSSFSNSSLNGQFALLMDGFDLNTQANLDRVGTLQWDGDGHLTLNETVNSGSGASSGVVLPGTYSIDTNGRAVGTITNLSLSNGDMVVYLISGTDGYILENDPGTEISGKISQQR
jgi:hypothetical protein